MVILSVRVTCQEDSVLLTFSVVPGSLHPMPDIIVVFSTCHEFIITSAAPKVRAQSSCLARSDILLTYPGASTWVLFV